MLRAYGGRRVTSRPPIRTWPASGVSSPAITRNSVVLPDPLGPSSAKELVLVDREIDLADRLGLAEALGDRSRICRTAARAALAGGADAARPPEG